MGFFDNVGNTTCTFITTYHFKAWYYFRNWNSSVSNILKMVSQTPQVMFMESSNSSWTYWLLKAETIRVFMVLFWLKCAIFNIVLNQPQFTLFVVKLKNQTSNQIKKNPIPSTFWRSVAYELILFKNKFISIYKEKRSKNVLPTASLSKIYYKSA